MKIITSTRESNINAPSILFNRGVPTCQDPYITLSQDLGTKVQ